MDTPAACASAPILSQKVLQMIRGWVIRRCHIASHDVHCSLTRQRLSQFLQRPGLQITKDKVATFLRKRARDGGAHTAGAPVYRCLAYIHQTIRTPG